MIRCIDQSPCLPEEKTEIWKAFVAGQDTEEIRQFLQEYCVLRHEDEERALYEGLISAVREREIGEDASVAEDFPEIERLAPRHVTRPLIIGQADIMPGRPTATAPLEALSEVREQPEPFFPARWSWFPPATVSPCRLRGS